MKNRRDFLKGLGVGGIGLKMLVCESIFNGLAAKAFAQSMGARDIQNFIHLSLLGGPPRWLFDLPMRPGGNDTLNHNPMVMTRFTRSSITSVMDNSTSYTTHQIAGLHFPHLWSANVPTSSGARPLSELARHGIFIRGMNTGADGHGVNRVKMSAPISGSPSTSGLFSDLKSTPITAVRRGTNLNFKGETGKGEIDAGGTNPLLTIMSPFNLTGNAFLSDSSSTSDFNRLTKAVSDQVGKNNPYLKSVLGDKKNALELVKRGVGDLGTIYGNLFAKYKGLMEQALTQSWLPGVDDLDIISPNSNAASNFPFRIRSSGTQRVIPRNNNLRDTLTQNSMVSNLAESFALAEYLIMNDLSSSVTLGVGDLMNLSFLNALDSGTGANLTANNFRSINDAHDTGAYATLFYFSKFYLALSSCMLELVRVLKANQKFTKTLIQVSSEFNRSARSNGTGSDHGWRGSNVSLYSGKIQAPEIIGNISAGGTGATYEGTWGVAAPSSEIGNREINIGNMISSVSTILGIRSVTSNDQSLVYEQGGVIKSIMSRGRNV